MLAFLSVLEQMPYVLAALVGLFLGWEESRRCTTSWIVRRGMRGNSAKLFGYFIQATAAILGCSVGFRLCYWIVHSPIMGFGKLLATKIQP